MATTVQPPIAPPAAAAKSDARRAQYLEVRGAVHRKLLGRLNLGGPAGAPALVIGAHLDHLGHGEASGSLARGDERGLQTRDAEMNLAELIADL